MFITNSKHSYWAVFTIDATTPQVAAECYSSIAKIGGLESTESSGKYYLSQVREPWLLIIDNADNPDLHLPSLFPPGNRGNILVTTRKRDFQEFGNVGSIELGGLEEDEALYLLLRSARISTPWDSAVKTAGNEITIVLGYLALAVKQAGTAISQKLCSLTEYLGFYQYYRKKRQRASSSSSGTIPLKIDSISQQDDIYSAFDLSFDYLERKQTVESQDAIAILNIVSFYHFRNIRVDIFERALRNQLEPSATSTFWDALARRLQPPTLLPHFLRRGIADTDPLYLKTVLRELYMCSLINYEEGAEGFYLHPLVHAWARDRIPANQRNLWAHLALNTLLEAVTLPSAGEETDSQFLRAIIPHLDECITASPVDVKISSSRLGKFGLIAFSLIFPTTVHILRSHARISAKCGYLYALSGRFAQSAHYLSMVKNVTVQTLGYNNAMTQKAMLFLADILWGLGQLKDCIALQRQVVEVRAKHLGTSHRETLQAMAKLGHSHWLNGQYTESLVVLEDTARMSSEALGPKDLDTLTVLDHLGVTLGSWHRYEESKALHEQVLEVRKDILGEDNLDTLTTMSNLAMAILDLGQREPAGRMMHQVYEMRKVKLGKEHPYTLWALCYLSKVHVELGYLNEAEDMLVGGIAAGKRSLGDEHLGVLMGCGELARVYAREGRLDEAEELTLTTVRKVRESRHSEHGDYIFGMWKLGQLYELKGEIMKALDVYQIALENTGPSLTEDHPLTKRIEMRILALESCSLSALEKGADVATGITDKPRRLGL